MISTGLLERQESNGLGHADKMTVVSIGWWSKARTDVS